jgi:acid stress chaperone HdeA
MNFKETALYITALIALGTSVASALPADPKTKKPITSWTCADFLAQDDQFKPKIVYAASTFAKNGKPLDTVIDIDDTEKVIPMVVDDCQKEPQSSFLQSLKHDWTKVDADAKAETKKVDKKL